MATPLDDIKKLRRIAPGLKVQLLVTFALWLVLVFLRAKLTEVFSPLWLIGIAIGWLMTAQLVWRARGAVDRLSDG